MKNVCISLGAYAINVRGCLGVAAINVRAGWVCLGSVQSMGMFWCRRNQCASGAGVFRVGAIIEIENHGNREMSGGKKSEQ